MAELAAAQTELLRILHRHRVEFVVVGGVAAQIRGWTGATNDLDVAVSSDSANVARVNAALAEAHAGPGMVGALGTVFETAHGRLEIVSVADGIGRYEDWARRASPETPEAGLTIVVADAADVVRSKEAAGRDKDLQTLPQMRRDLIEAGALDAQTVQGPVADPPAEPDGPPEFLVELLGPRPADSPGRWDIAAEAILDYRQRWSVSGDGLGNDGVGGSQADDRRKLEHLIERARSS